MARVTVSDGNGTPIGPYYEDRGSGQPVILIHGWPLSSRSWEQQVPALVEDGHRVITYDRRGFGASSQPWDGYDYDSFADNPEGGIDDATLTGFHDGIRADRVAFVDQFVTSFFSVRGSTDLVSEPLRRYNAAIAAAASPKGTLDCTTAFTKTDFRRDLEGFTVPTLVIHGDSDAIVPFEVSGRRTAEAIDGSKLVLVPDAPHGLNVTHAQTFNAEVLAFLRS